MIVRADGRPHPTETVSGDGWSIDWDGPICRVAVVDGLGHGPEAARATEAAVRVLAANPTLPPDEALRRCHRALQGTRGAAVSVARIDPVAHRLVYAGVGNVEARLWRDGGQDRLIALRGIVGSVIPTIRTFEYDLGDDWLLLLHTDGISSRFGGTDVDACIQTEPLDLVSLLLEHWSRPQDDATVLVVRPHRSDRDDEL